MSLLNVRSVLGYLRVRRWGAARGIAGRPGGRTHRGLPGTAVARSLEAIPSAAKYRVGQGIVLFPVQKPPTSDEDPRPGTQPKRLWR